MGSRPAPSPQVKKVKAPPPPKVVPTPTQAVRTQSALDEVSAAQQRLNMELGAQLDRTNTEFFTGQDIRRARAVGTEERLSTATRGEQERTTNLQQEMYRRYKENRDYEQAQQQYRV